MNRDNLVSLAHALSGVAVMVVSLYTKDGLPGPTQLLKNIGFAIFGLGMAFFAYTVIYLKDAFRGNVQPVSDDLITSGPYKIVRHPLYLGMVITIVGLALGMRSVWGLIATVLLFIPLAIYRARLEEQALEAKFGGEWRDFVERTYFMFPPLF